MCIFIGKTYSFCLGVMAHLNIKFWPKYTIFTGIYFLLNIEVDQNILFGASLSNHYIYAI